MDGRPSVDVVFRHNKVVDDAFTRRVFDVLVDDELVRYWEGAVEEHIAHVRTGLHRFNRIFARLFDLFLDKKPSHEEVLDGQFATLLAERIRSDDRKPMEFRHRHPRHEGEAAVNAYVSLNLQLRAPPAFYGSNQQANRMKFFNDKRDNWVRMGTSWRSLGYLNPEDTFETQWFLGVVRKLFPLFEPDYACAHFDVDLARNIRSDPMLTAWPVILFGPELVAKFGRENLLEAPVWNVEALDGGSLWLQLAENPFTAPPDELKKLAKYLGLKAPR